MRKSMTDIQSSPWTLTARWILPVSSPPLEHGTVTMAGDRIVAVNARGECQADVDLGNVAVLPGLVNAHTHLDLTGLRGLAPPSPDFTRWLRQVIAHRRSRTPEQVRADVQTGLAEALRFGTTLLGDITGDEHSGGWRILEAAPLRWVLFLELLGLPAERARATMSNLLPWWTNQTASTFGRLGLGPHAPYSFRAQMLPLVSQIADRVTIHLAETTAELELLERQDGPFVPFLSDLGVWDPTGLVSSPGQVVEFTKSAKTVLYAHCNYLSPETPIPSHGTIVYCPRTHAAFGHPPHPFREFLKRGVRVALGTDSLASNPDLDLLAEMRFLHARYPDVSGDVVLRLGTLSGAEALNWADETGSLTPGKSADLVVLPLPAGGEANPYWLIFESALQVTKVLCRGRWL
jgi:cytosine/adenosine deaminase-related metal-dependent hydrolase